MDIDWLVLIVCIMVVGGIAATVKQLCKGDK